MRPLLKRLAASLGAAEPGSLDEERILSALLTEAAVELLEEARKRHGEEHAGAAVRRVMERGTLRR